MSEMLPELIILTEKLTNGLDGLEGDINRIEKNENKQEFALNHLAVLLRSINEARQNVEVYRRSEIQLEKDELKEVIELAWSKLPHVPFYSRYVSHKKGTRSFEVLGELEFYYDYIDDDFEEPLRCIELGSIPIDVKEFAEIGILKSTLKELLLIEMGGNVHLVLVDVVNNLYEETKNVSYNRNDLTISTIDEVIEMFSLNNLKLGILSNIDQTLVTLSEKVKVQIESLVVLLDVI